MREFKSHAYAWSVSWIEFKAPNAQGVYCLRNKDGKALFIGKGNVRERLLSHWYKQNPADAAIWSNSPHSFRFELTDNSDQRAAELIRQLKPACQPVVHSFFGRH